MKKIYLAAPLFDSMELRRNIEVCEMLESLGHEVFMPQRDSGEAFEGADRAELFVSDVTAIGKSNCVVALLDGRVPDEGTVFEMGLAYAWGIPIVALRTDRRSFMQGQHNVMLIYSVAKECTSMEELKEYMKGQ